MMGKIQHPISVEPERVWRLYRGGSMIDALHGRPGQEDSHFPEEWILSIVEARNAGREEEHEGLNRLTEGGMTLKSLIDSHPEEILGREHAARWGATTSVLLKVIDAAERLSVQVHPDKATALRLFQSPFGKTECWHILGGRDMGGETAHIYAGFQPGVTRELWKDIFDRQDIPAMLACLHKLTVKPGDTILIRGGLPHAIGAGCLLMEIQEPTDYTIRTERTNVQGELLPDAMCHQGIGFEAMFDCFHYEGTTEEQLRSKITEYQLAIAILRPLDSEERATVFFMRNQAVALTKIDLSLVMLGEAAMDVFNSLCAHSFMMEKIKLTVPARRKHDDLRILLQYLILCQRPEMGFSGNEIMSFCDDIKNGEAQVDAARVVEVMEYLDAALPEKRQYLKKLHVPVVMYVAQQAKENGVSPAEFGARLDAFFETAAENAEYVEACTSGSAKRSNVQTRVRILSESCKA